MKHLKTMQFINVRLLATWLALSVLSMSAQAGELVYVPTNPTFGGNPNNASGLMAVATAQNDYKADAAPKQTALEKFTASVQSAVLSRLTSDTIEKLYPTKGPLKYNDPVTVGDFTVEFKQSTDNNLIMITTELSTGARTEIVVGSLPTTTPSP